MKRRALAVVLTLMMLVSVLPMAAYAAKFSDTVGHWAESSIDRWTDEGVLQGVGDNMFMPNEFITRAQSAAVFTRLLKLTDTADVSQFTDVEAGSWYEEYVGHAVAYGIFNGTSATTFNPNGYITRQDFFLTFARAVGIPEQSTCNNTTLQDLGQVSAYARGAVYALINLGYVNGRSTTELQPLAYITRAEVAKILDNVISDYITEDGSYRVSDNNNGITLVLAKNVSLSGNPTTVVAAAEDGTIDMSGVTNPPTINAIRKNVKVNNAPAQTTINSEEEGTEINGTPVNEDNSYTVPGEQQPVTPPAGGGGGGGTTVSTYKVEVFFSAGGMKTGTAAFLTASKQARTASLETVATALYSGDNKTAIENAIGGILDKFTGDPNVSVGTTNYNVVVAKTGANYTLQVKTGGTAQDLMPFVKEQQQLFETRMATVSAANGDLATAHAAQWNALVSALGPVKLFNETKSFANAAAVTGTATTLTFRDDSDTGYYQVITDIVDAFVGLQQALLADNWTATQFQGLFKGVNSVINLNACTNFAPMAAQTAPLLQMIGTTDLINESVNSTGTAAAIANSAAAMIDDVFSRDFSSNDIAKAILQAAASKGVLGGDYTLSVKVTKAG